MEKSSLNKISKIILLFLAVTLIGSFCFQIASASHNHGAVMQNFSTSGGSAKNMMPCCEENTNHLALSDLPSTKNPLQFMSLILLVFASVGLVLSPNIFSNFAHSFSSLAPPGPDLLLTVVKKE